MKDRIKAVPIEPDTKILFQKEGKLQNYDVRYEIWSWDGIEAESIIFSNDDVSALTDQEIESLVRKSAMVKVDSAMTLNRSDSGYTFCNFNFE